MAEYGKFLGIYDPNKENVYKIICEYFDYPQMVKVKNDENTFSLYDKNKLYADKCY